MQERRIKQYTFRDFLDNFTYSESVLDQQIKQTKYYLDEYQKRRTRLGLPSVHAGNFDDIHNELKNLLQATKFAVGRIR